MIIKKGYCIWFVILIIAVISAGAVAQAEVKEGDLISVLKSSASKGEKAITCKKLAIYGTEQCVASVAPLLADKELSSWARIALEAIPGPAADVIRLVAATALFFTKFLRFMLQSRVKSSFFKVVVIKYMPEHENKGLSYYHVPVFFSIQAN